MLLLISIMKKCLQHKKKCLHFKDLTFSAKIYELTSKKNLRCETIKLIRYTVMLDISDMQLLIKCVAFDE